MPDHSAGRGGHVVRVLDVDPSLGRQIPEPEFKLAQRSLVAPAIELARGRWAASDRRTQ